MYFLSASSIFAQNHKFILTDGNSTAKIYLSDKEAECVKLAVDDLISDVFRISGKKLEIVNDTTGTSQFIRIETKHDNTSWESYNVKSANGSLYISGSDERGTMSGIYHFIEKYLKVDPFYIWSGLYPDEKEELSWNDVDISSNGPDFKYRGWFINDEDLLTFWKEGGGKRTEELKRKGTNTLYLHLFPPEVMEMIVETLVRSRYNLIIPASFIDINNPAEEELVKVCARRGIFISQHHQEPLGVSPYAFFEYWNNRKNDVKYSYYSHKYEIQEAWRNSVKKWSKYTNVIWQLGLRGIGDRPVWESDADVPAQEKERGELISGAIHDQVEILNEICSQEPVFSLTLWHEGSKLNQEGLIDIPDGAIIVFADNTPGWMWQEDFYSTQRKDNYKYGLYYHHALNPTGPHNAQVVPPHQTYRLLIEAYNRNSHDYAVFNVSNIREFVLGIAATSEMTWDINSFNPDNWLVSWVKQKFSAKHDEIANAYKIYFSSYLVYEYKPQIPYLMYGQMIRAGKRNIRQMKNKIENNQIGLGTGNETLQYRGHLSPNWNQIPGEDLNDSLWITQITEAVCDEIGRRETIKRLSRQIAGFELAVLHVSTIIEKLPKSEACFLSNNLLFQSNLVLYICQWLKYILFSHESLDIGDLETAFSSLDEALKSLLKTDLIIDDYNQNNFKNWYRGNRIHNIESTKSLTLEIKKKVRDELNNSNH